MVVSGGLSGGIALLKYHPLCWRTRPETHRATWRSGAVDLGVAEPHGVAAGRPLLLRGEAVSLRTTSTAFFKEPVIKTHTSLILCAAALAVVGLAWLTPAQADLVGYWNFNEGEGTTAGDFSPNANDGTLAGNQLPSWVAGHTANPQDNALNFVFSFSSYVAVPTSASLGTITTNFTIAAWAYEREESNYGHIVVTTSDYSNRNWLFQTDAGDQAYVWSTTDGAWQKPLGWAIPDGAWHHIALTYDGIDMRSYLDDTLQTTIGVGSTFPSFETLYLGGWLAGGSGFLGDLDDMVIFNSVEDIGQIKDGTHPAMMPALPLVWDAETVATDAQDGGGTWSHGGDNWWNGSGNVAWDNTKADVAAFGAGNATADTTVTVDAVTASGIVFNDANGHTYTLTGGTITLEGGAAIEANVDARIESAIAAAAGFTKTGPGTLALAGARNLAALNLVEGTTRLTSGGTSSLVTEALSVAPAAALDLADNNLIVDYTDGASPFDDLVALVEEGYNDVDTDGDGYPNLWEGTGITSAEARDNSQLTTGLAIIANDDPLSETSPPKVGGLSHLEGVPVDPTSILIKYGWTGDANLDGVINSNDYDLIDTAWMLWSNEGRVPEGGFRYAVGDFNYDGIINSNDYDMIDRAWVLSEGAPLGGGAPAPTPEPATLALLAAGLAGLVVRKRRT